MPPSSDPRYLRRPYLLRVEWDGHDALFRWGWDVTDCQGARVASGVSVTRWGAKLSAKRTLRHLGKSYTKELR